MKSILGVHLGGPAALNRNYLFIRSIAFNAVTKLFGLFVAFACLPLAALSLQVGEYAAFNFSMAATSLLAVVFGPIGATFVVRFAHLSSHDDKALKDVAEEALAIFLGLGAVLLLPAFAAAYWLSPSAYRSEIGTAAMVVIATATLSWTEIFRLGVRQDHISSAFALANNITIITGFAVLYRLNLLNFHRVLGVYYLSPLLWALASFVQLTVTKSIKVRVELAPHRWKDALVHARPNMLNSASDYIKLYASSFVAFQLSTPQSYAVFSTFQLLVARLINPLSLIARPLIPAYIDAVVRNDVRWIGYLKKSLFALSIIAVLSTFLVTTTLLAAPPNSLHLGAISLSGSELVWYIAIALLLFGSTASLAILSSVYLACHQMELFSRACFLSNLLALAAGGLATARIGPIGMFAALAVTSMFAASFLTWRFITGFASSSESVRT